MLGLMGFSGSLPLYVVHRCYKISLFVDWANKDACLLSVLQQQKLGLQLVGLSGRGFDVLPA